MRARARVVLSSLMTSAVIAGLAGVGLAPAASAADPSIDGTVTSASGDGLADVVVEAHLGSSAGVVTASTTTSVAGSYALDVPGGTYSLTFTPPAATGGVTYAPVTAVFVEAPRDWPLDVVLTPPAPGRVFVTGDLTLDSGTPLVGGSVLFAGSGVQPGTDGYFSMGQRSGVTGTWSFRGTASPAAGGSLYLSATGGPSSTLLQDTDAQLTVPVTTTSVTVRDGSGSPARGATVRLNSGGYGKAEGSVPVFAGATPFTSSWTATAITDESGVAVLTRPVLSTTVVGTLMVDAPSSTWVSSSTDVSVPVVGGLLNASLGTARVMTSGRVTWSDGPGIPGVVVTAVDPSSPVNSGNSADASGAYAISEPAGFVGLWQVSTRSQAALATADPLVFSLRGGASRTWVSASVADFVVPRTSARMRIVDAAGAGVAGAAVSVVLDDSSPSLPRASVRLRPGEPVFLGTWSARGTTGSDGFVSLPVLASDVATTMRVTVSPAAGSASGSRTLSLASTSLDGSSIVLPTVGRVTSTGRVTYSDGSPVPGAVVIPFSPSASVNSGVSADLAGVYSVVEPAGFVGTWQISGRPQGSLAVQDPLWFTLRGGAPRTWLSDFGLDVAVPKNLYRVRVVDTAGNPITHALVVASVDDALGAASVPLLAGEPAFVGTWRGRDFTGVDGYAQVPGVISSNITNLTVSVNTDAGSRFVARTLKLRSSALAETVIVLQSFAPKVSAFTPKSVAPGDVMTVNGSNLGGLTRVVIGGVPQEFVVRSETQVEVRVASNTVSGTLTLTGPGGTVSPGRVTVTSRDLAIESGAIPNGMVGTANSASLVVSGGLAPYTWTRTSGSLPTGVTLSPGGVLAGTPTRALSGTFGATVTDARGTSVSRIVSWTVEPKPATVPGPIVRLTASPGALRMSLAWAAPADNGGNVITGYRIERSVNGSTWTSVIDNTAATTLGVSFVEVGGVPTRYRVAAINAAGVGAFGDASVAGPVAAYDVPSAPTAVTLSRVTSSVVSVRWSMPSSNGGAPVTGYRVRTSTNGGSAWTTVVASTASSSTTVPARAGQATVVQVAAMNLAGLGPYVSVGPIN